MIEIDIQKLERGTHTEMVTVKRDDKVFQRKQRVGRKEKDKTDEQEAKTSTLRTNVPGWGEMPAITSDKAKIGDKKFHYGAIYTIVDIEEKPRTIILTLESPKGETGKAKYKKTEPLVLQEHYESELKDRGKTPNLVDGYYK